MGREEILGNVMEDVVGKVGNHVKKGEFLNVQYSSGRGRATKKADYWLWSILIKLLKALERNFIMMV